jgi:hypothetical protein
MSSLLDSCFSRILMAVDEVECNVVEPLTLSWGVQICRSSCLASHWCEVFGRVIEVLPMWQCLLTDLKISSQAIEDLVLGDCKSASPGRNKVSFLTEPLASTKGKTFVHTLLPLTSGEILKTSFWILHLVSLSLRSNWGHRPTRSFEGDETKE